MKTTSLTHKLPALLLVILGAQLGLAPAAGAHHGLLGLGLLAPPTAPPTAPPAAQPAQAPAGPFTLVDVEHRLATLRYDVGPLDGQIDAQAAGAVMAFQKVHGLPRTGELTDQLVTQIMSTQGTPSPMVPGGEAHRVEVSLARQVLFLYEGGTLTKILSISSGTAATPTPTGTFRIYRQDVGWQTSRLGRLHNAQYFVGGYAIHGSLSVPAGPASHGCIRIPMTASAWFPSHVARGMQVVITAS